MKLPHLIIIRKKLLSNTSGQQTPFFVLFFLLTKIDVEKQLLFFHWCSEKKPTLRFIYTGIFPIDISLETIDIPS